MKKKIIKKGLLLTIAASVLTCTLGACSQSEQTTSDDDTFDIAYISPAPFEDGGWGTSCYAGFHASVEKFDNVKTYEVENVSLENQSSTLIQYCDMGVELIVTNTYDLTDAIAEVAPNYPDTKFAVIDGTYEADNAMCMSQDNAQIGFMVGVIAALQTETKSVAFVGGESSGEIVKASDAMEAGAKYIDPSITFTSVMSGSWTDVALGKEIALSLINDNNADVLFSFASGVDFGVREACEESEGVYFIAQPIEALNDSPEITITSIIQSNEQLIYNAIESAYNDEFVGEFTIYGFEDGGTCSFGQFNDLFDADKQARVDEILEKVLSGEIDVYSYV